MKPPRGLIVLTGEQLPRGQSVVARLVIAHVGPGDIAPTRLTECQRDAAAGLYAGALSGFVSWHAARKAEVDRTRAAAVTERRVRWMGRGHARSASNLATLEFALGLWLKFLAEAGIEPATIEALRPRLDAGLAAAAAANTAATEGIDPTDLFFALLSSALRTGRAHLAHIKGGAPAGSRRWGWEPQGREREERPRGAMIGWVDGEDVYLDPHASHRLITNPGNFGMSRETLARRLHERGHLVTTEKDAGGKALGVRRMVAGSRHWVWHVSARAFGPGE